MTKINPFADMEARAEALQTGEALSIAGDSAALNGRARVLRSACEPLARIKPVLKSRYLVKGWLDREAASVVYGASNVGKTFFALDLAVHVAAGRAWHGHKVPKSSDNVGGVLYIAGEGGAGIRNRIAALREAMPDLVREAERAARMTLLPTSLDLSGGEDVKALLEAAGDKPLSLIIVDTLARAMGDGDENTARDMGAFVRNVDRLREATGAHVLVVHHTGKDETRGARGSNSLRGAVDTEILISRNGDVIQAETKKQRDGRGDAMFAYRLRDVPLGLDEDGEQVVSAVIEPTEPVQKGPKLSPQQTIALQALDDALAHHGEKKHGDLWPDNRRCVSMEVWREFCDRHSLTVGASDSASRQAFGRAWKALQEKALVRVVDGFVWRC